MVSFHPEVPNQDQEEPMLKLEDDDEEVEEHDMVTDWAEMTWNDVKWL